MQASSVNDAVNELGQWRLFKQFQAFYLLN